MPTTCDIDFENNPQKVIYAGQVLRGTVRLNLTDEKTVRGIYILIEGKAYAHWTKGSGKDSKSYTGSEDYLSEKSYFLGGSIGEIRVTPGTYHYTFQCMLPAGLPTSVEGTHGHIRYTATVVLDIPMWPDPTFEVPFSVLKAIDLNADPALREPVVAEKNKTFFLCCLLCCCSSDPLKIVGRTPVGGYTPGQIINLQFNINNDSDQPVSEFTVQLIKKITYYTHANSSSTTYETVIITEQDTRGCDVNSEEIIRVNIEVPPMPPTDSSTSNIVKVQYSVRIIGSVACCHSNPILELPITIGSYPIQDFTPGAPYLPPNTMTSEYSSAPENSQFPDPNLPTAPLLHSDYPPTYEDAAHFKDTTDNDHNFKPKYAMFKRTTSYSSGN